MTQSNENKTDPEFFNEVDMEFVFIKPGTFIMGRTPYREDKGIHEFKHPVTLTSRYYIQTTPVTQKQWETIMGINPSHFKDSGSHAPVENVTWQDTQDFIAKLNRLDRPNHYRLPTEAEWEYAARAGSEARFCYGNDYSQLESYAWYKGNSGMRTHPVARKRSNAWGIFDIIGNVWDWCLDWRGEYPLDEAIDPTGPPEGRGKVLRGGSWGSDVWYLHSTDRHSRPPEYCNYNVGFRLVKAF